MTHQPSPTWKASLSAILIALLVLAALTSCDIQPSLGLPAPSPAPTLTNPLDSAWDDRAPFRAGLIDAERAVLDGLSGATVYHMDLEIPGDFQVLKGRQEVRYTNREDVPLREVYFRLFANTAGGKSVVSNVQVDGQTVEPAYELQNSALRVPLDPALQPGESVVIGMDFAVTVPRDMGGNYGLFGYFDDVLVLDEFYPVIPVYDDEGWNVEVPPPNADVPYFDASLYLVRVTAPAGLTVVASGIEVGREDQGGTQALTFAIGPARGFYIAASERYTVVSEKVGETTVNSYAFQDCEDGARLALQQAGNALKSYNARFGIYPYTEFDVVSTPMQALGMEYPGIVAITLDEYDIDGTVRGVPARIMMEGTVAHEVAHQWFYNVVGNDQVDEPWLDEALAQYLTGLYYVDTYDESAAQSYRTSWYDRWDRVGRATIPIGLPAADYTGKEYGAIVYGRGPIFVEALADKLGPKFDGFLRDYYTSHKWGIATTTSYKQTAERHCQCDLTPLFEEWVYEK